MALVIGGVIFITALTSLSFINTEIQTASAGSTYSISASDGTSTSAVNVSWSRTGDGAAGVRYSPNGLTGCKTGSNLSCSGDSQICLTIDDDDFYKYLGKLPYDPDKDSNSDSGYYLQKDANDNLIVGSCASYNSEEIIKRPKVRINCLVYAGGYCWHLSENDNTTCNAVCSGFNLDCINGATYGPDLDSEDNAYCALQKHINSGYCPLVCSELGAIGSPPIISISLTCQIQNGPLDCNHSSDHNEFPVCPCQ